MLKTIWLLAVATLVVGGCARTGSVGSGTRGSHVDSARSLDEGIADLSSQINTTLTSRAAKRIAVVDLTMDDRQTKLGQYMAEKLHNRLFLTRRFDLVERSQMTKALREIKRGRTAYFDASTVKQLGKQLGAEAIVTGTMTDLGEVVDVNLRMIATDTGVTFAVADSPIFKGPIVQRLLIPVTASLSISTTPPEASVEIDGVPRAKGADGVVRANVNPGQHRVSVRHPPCYEDYEKTLPVKGDTPLSVTLAPKTSVLKVIVEPATTRVNVWIDGQPVSRSSNEGGISRQLPCGRYQVVVRPIQGKFLEYHGNVELKGDQTIVARLNSQPRTQTPKPRPRQRPAKQPVKATPEQPRFDNLISQLFGLKHPDPRFRIRVWAGKPSYRVGETAVVSFQADRDAYVTLFNLGTSGKLTLLYPNPFARNNFVRAGEVVQFPRRSDAFEYVIDGPRGTERIKAIATTTPLALSGVQLSSGRFARWGPNNTRDIGILTRDLAVVPKHNWTETTYSFDVK